MIEDPVINLAEYFEFVFPNTIRIKGHRIAIEHILHYFHQGYSPEEIAQEFPGLALEKIYACIMFYFTYKDQVESYLEKKRKNDLDAYDKWDASPSPLIKRLRVIRDDKLKYQ